MLGGRLGAGWLAKLLNGVRFSQRIPAHRQSGGRGASPMAAAAAVREGPAMSKTAPKRKRVSLQKNISIPRGSWGAVEEAMRIDGVENFSAFALAAIMQRTARLKRQQALLDARQVSELAPKLRALLAEMERKS